MNRIGQMYHWILGRAGKPIWAPWEVALMRLGFGYALWMSYWPGLGITGQPDPMGLACFFDTTWVASDQVVSWLLPLYRLLVILYVLGVAPMISTTGTCVVHLFFHALRNSTGSVGHAYQIISLVLLAQTVAHWADWIKAWHAGTMKQRSTAPIRRVLSWVSGGNDEAVWAQQARGREIWMTLQMIAAAYVVSGISKVWHSSGEWIQNVPNIAVAFMKTWNQNYYTTLDSTTPGWVMGFAQKIGEYPNLFRCFFSVGLFLELFFFLFIARRGLMAIGGLLLISFHMLNELLLGLGFHWNCWIAFLFLVNVPFWAYWLSKKLRGQSVEDKINEALPDSELAAKPEAL